MKDFHFKQCIFFNKYKFDPLFSKYKGYTNIELHICMTETAIVHNNFTCK